MVISRVFTGSSNVQNAGVVSFPFWMARLIRKEAGTSAIKSDEMATAIAAGKLGTAAAILRYCHNRANRGCITSIVMVKPCRGDQDCFYSDVVKRRLFDLFMILENAIIYLY